MRISILHPSRSRPAQAAKTAKAWLRRAKDISRLEYVISIDKSDDRALEYMKINPKAGISFSILSSNNNNAIEAINSAAELCKGDLLIVVSDDFNQPPFHWDEYLISVLEGKSDYLVKTQDGIQKTLITLPIMDRVYYERFGYIYHPEYQHMFCDQEMTAVGHMLGRVIDLPLRIPHNHYSTGKTPKDNVSVKNDATWKQGERVFFNRLRSNFGIESPVMKYSDIVWH